MYREKKIAKIRAKVTPVKHIPRGTGETMELLFDIQFLLDELDRLQAERDSHGPEGRNYTNKQYVDLLMERDKLIEVLRFYERLARGREVNDGGRRARTLLAEIGVTVE